MEEDIVARLRDATGEAHARLEAGIDILRRIGSSDTRRALVERFWGLHEGAERALTPMLEAVDGLDFKGRRRAELIAADLARLDQADGGPVAICPVPDASSKAEALGFFYVLEGSTLGGKVIRRELAAQGQNAKGLSFLDPYGIKSGERWRAFLAVLRRECPSERGQAADEMVGGAMSAFRHAEGWLCPATVTP